MKIVLRNIKVSELVEGYEDKAEEGVRGYGGRLNIRPAYQREFIYKEKQRNEVVHTVRKGFPLNTIYGEHAFNRELGQTRHVLRQARGKRTHVHRPTQAQMPLLLGNTRQ